MATQIVGDSLFCEVFLLETRREEILSHYGEADNHEELDKELAEIETTLQKHYSFMDDICDWRNAQKAGVPL